MNLKVFRSGENSNIIYHSSNLLFSEKNKSWLSRRAADCNAANFIYLIACEHFVVCAGVSRFFLIVFVDSKNAGAQAVRQIRKIDVFIVEEAGRILLNAVRSKNAALQAF